MDVSFLLIFSSMAENISCLKLLDPGKSSGITASSPHGLVLPEPAILFHDAMSTRSAISYSLACPDELSRCIRYLKFSS